MSGGHWGYLAEKFRDLGEDVAERNAMTTATLEVMAEIEHQLDWGISCDTCYECAKNRIVPALEEFFTHRGQHPFSALALLRDGKQNQCEKCAARRVS